NADRINIAQVGCVGDGVTDNAARLNALGLLGLPLYIPKGTFKIADQVLLYGDVWADGVIAPTTAIGARAAVVIATTGAFGQQRSIHNLYIQGDASVRAA